MNSKFLVFGLIALVAFASFGSAVSVVGQDSIRAIPVTGSTRLVTDGDSFEGRIAALAASSVGQSVPSEFNYLVGDGNLRVKFLRASTVDSAVFDSDSSDSKYGVLSYVVVVHGGKVVSATKGTASDGSYSVVLAVTRDAATRILDSSDPASQVKQEMAGSAFKYRPMGLVAYKFQVINAIRGLIGMFSPSLASGLEFLQGAA